MKGEAMRALLIALSAALSGLPAAAAAVPNPLAERLADARAEAKQPVELEILLRLQLAAGRWRDAEATIGRLESAYKAARPGLAPALVPWRIYARARSH